jgi:hypothetical protein
MLAELRQLADGYDHLGQRVDRATQIAAINQYQQVQELKGRRFIEEARREDQAKLLLAQAEATRKKAETEAEVERRRVAVEEGHLQLEAFKAKEQLKLDAEQLTGRLQIDKADVLVRALQVAVDGGIDPNQLLLAIQGLGDRLLPAPEGIAPALQLEAKGKD